MGQTVVGEVEILLHPVGKADGPAIPIVGQKGQVDPLFPHPGDGEVRAVNFDEYESRMYFERTLRKAGVFDMLEARGIQEKDTVDVLGIQFEYVY